MKKENYWEELRNSLPANWVISSISEVFEVNPGHKGLNIDEETEVRFVPMTAIFEVINKTDLSATKPYKEVKSGFTKFKEKDVLFAKITPCMENGKIAVAENLKNGIGCGTTELHVFRPVEEFTNKFLFYFLVQDLYRIYAKTSFNGAVGHQRVPTNFFEEQIFPLPPLAEQKRIVAKLDEAFQHLDTLKGKLQRIPELLKNFRQAVLTQAVTGKLTDAGSFSFAPIDSFCESSFYGPRFSKDEYNINGVPTVRTTDMRDNGSIEVTKKHQESW